MALPNIGANLTLNNGNFFVNCNKAVSATGQLKKALLKATGQTTSHYKATNTLSNGLSQLKNTILGVVGAYAGLQGLKQMLSLSDTLVMTNSRLDLMNDGLQTNEEFQRKIYETAQASRTPYLTLADTISKLGTQTKGVFASNDELLSFGDTLSKQFVIAGTDATMVEHAMVQITQALGSGVLRGDELNSVFENAPPIMQAIADYLDTDVGKLRDMASKGELTADVFKNAILAATDKVNAQFDNMPLTFGQAMTKIKNAGIQGFTVVSQAMSTAFNSENVQTKIKNFINAIPGMFTTALDYVTAKWADLKKALEPLKPVLESLKNACVQAFYWVANTGIPLMIQGIAVLTPMISVVYFWFVNNWGAIKPIIIGIIGAIVAMKAAAMMGSVIRSIDNWIGVLRLVPAAYNEIASGKWFATNYKNITALGSKTKEIFAGIKTGVSALKYTTGSGLGSGAMTATDLLASTNISGTEKTIANVTAKIGTAFTGLFSKIGAGMKALFVTGPWGWIILGIAAVVTAFVVLWKKSEAFRNFWLGIWENIKQGAAVAWEWIKTAFNAIVDAMTPIIESALPMLQDAWNGLVEAFKGLWAAIKPILTPIVAMLKETLPPIIQSLKQTFSECWATIKQAIGSAMVAIGNALKPLISRFGEHKAQIVAVAQTVVKSMGVIIQIVWKVVGAILVVAVKIIAIAIQISIAIVTAVVKIVTWIVNGVTWIINGCVWLYQQISLAFQNIWNFIVFVWEGITSAIVTAWNFIVSTATTVFTAIWNTITTIFNAMWNTIVTIWNTISGFISTLWNGIWTTATNIFDGIKNTITSVWDSIWNAIKATGEWVKGIFESIFGGIKTIYDNTVGWVFDKIQQGWNALKGLVSGTKDATAEVTVTGVQPHALGGVVSRTGGISLVGEKGPELINLPAGTHVSTANETERLLRGSASTTNNFEININGTNLTPEDIINRLVPKLKFALANM